MRGELPMRMKLQMMQSVLKLLMLNGNYHLREQPSFGQDRGLMLDLQQTHYIILRVRIYN